MFLLTLYILIKLNEFIRHFLRLTDLNSAVSLKQSLLVGFLLAHCHAY